MEKDKSLDNQPDTIDGQADNTKKKLSVKEKIKKFGLKRIIGLAIVIIGIGIVSYAVIIPAYNAYLNEKRVEEVRNAISAALKESGNENGDDNYKGSGMSQAEYEALSVSDKEKIDAQIRKEKAAQSTVADLDIIGIVEIEKLNITYAIVEGTKNIDIKASIGHLSESTKIGADGTCVLAGHRGGMYGEMFNNIDKLEAGDLVVVTDLTGTEYTYEVYEHRNIKSKDWSILDWVDNQITLVLLTCEKSGYGRLCVMCRMVDVTEDKEGNQIIDVLKPTTTQPPTAVPTAEPTIEPRKPKFHIKITNEFGQVLMDQDTDDNGKWDYNFVEGTYIIERTYSNGDIETETRKYGSGVASKVSKYVVTDSNDRIVANGQTDSEGNYEISLEPGDYVITFTDVFGQVTKKEVHVD